MLNYDVTDTFYDLLKSSSIFVSSNVEYSKVKTDLEFFIKYGFISDSDIKVSNDKITNAKSVFNKIYYNLNLTGDENDNLLDKLNNYLYGLMVDYYKNRSKRHIKTKLDFIRDTEPLVINIFYVGMSIFGDPIVEFFFEFLKSIRASNDDRCAKVFYWYFRDDETKGFFANRVEDALISNWVTYARIVLENNNNPLFN